MPRYTGTQKASLGRNGRLWRASRKALLARESECWICARKCPDFEWPPGEMPFESAIVDKTLKWPHPASASVDHVIPISMLGADDPRLYRLDNLRLAHLRCNSKRGDGKRLVGSKPSKTSRNWLV